MSAPRQNSAPKGGNKARLGEGTLGFGNELTAILEELNLPLVA